MLASMYSAVSGLQAHQTKMNVIGNNIANVNTYGFKKSRATFTDVFYQTLTGSSAATQTSGGTNSSQLGYGATVNSIDVIHKTAGSSTTDRALDVYINGDGYLAVKDSNGTVNYTRVGILSFDASGNLVDSNGNFVLGFKLDETSGQAQLNSDGTTTVQNLVRINVPVEELDQYTSISIGSNGEITAIKQGDQTFTIGQTSWLDSAADMAEDTTLTGSVSVTDVTDIATSYAANDTDNTTNKLETAVTSGTPFNVSGDIKFSYTVGADPTDESQYSIKYTDLDGNNQTKTPATAELDGTQYKLTFHIPKRGVTYDAADPATFDTYTIKETADDVFVNQTATNLVTGTNKIDSAKISISTFNKAGQTVTSSAVWTNSNADTSQLQFLSDSGNLTLNVKNELLAKAMETKGVDSIEDIIGSIDTGDGTAVKIAQLALGTFSNEGGLSQNGQGYFLPSNNSGSSVIKIPGTGGTGSLRSGALEMSNVDLSFEFTEMIICQRGFQANTKMITVSDEMLSELVSMKR